MRHESMRRQHGFQCKPKVKSSGPERGNYFLFRIFKCSVYLLWGSMAGSALQRKPYKEEFVRQI